MTSNNKGCHLRISSVFVFFVVFSFSVMAEIDNYVNVYKGFYIGEILPTPKTVKYSDIYLPIYRGKGGKASACIVIGKDASNLERLAAMELNAQTGYLLKERTENTHLQLLKILDTTKSYDNYDVIISIGQINTNELNKKYNDKYKGAAVI